MAVQIDPKTGERVGSTPQIDPNTGERIAASSVAGAGPLGTPGFPGPPPVDMQESSIPGIVQGAKDFGIGVAKGAGSTANNIGHLAVPDWVLNAAGAQGPSKDQQESYFAPKNTTQAVGKGAEQVGEFLVPGLGEEAATAKLGKFAPLGRMAYQAATTGAVNKAQGGDFSTGAATGLFGGAVGEGMRAVAPKIAESALNIRKLDRAYKGKGAIGRAILDETKGFKPGTVADSAQERLTGINSQLESAADNASKIQPLTDKSGNPLTVYHGTTKNFENFKPGVSFFSPSSEYASRFATEEGGNIRPSRIEIKNPYHTDIQSDVEGAHLFPDWTQELQDKGHDGIIYSKNGDITKGPSGWGDDRPQYVVFSPKQVESTLSGGGKASASLAPARDVLTDAAVKATRQGERTTLNQLAPMNEHLSETIGGNPIPSDVTPRQLLDLKRGFGNEFIHRWNPETMEGVKGTAAQTYHALGQEFNRAVPEAAGLNARSSALIPVAKRAASEELNAPTTQKLFHRVAAPTGALTGSIFGAKEGYDHGGIGGAIGGAVAGTVAPLLFTSPTGQMVLARGLNSPTARNLLFAPPTGAALQLNRPANNAKHD